MKRRVAKDIPWNCSQNNQVGFLFVVSNYSIFHISVNPERKTNPGKLCWGTEGFIYRIYYFHEGLSSSLSTCPCCPFKAQFAQPTEKHPRAQGFHHSPAYSSKQKPKLSHIHTRHEGKLDILLLCAHIFTRLLKENKYYWLGNQMLVV